MVVIIVLHLYSLLLPCFILQSIVVVIVWQFLLCYTCIHYYYHASYFSPSWSWSYGSSYCVTLVFTTITMLHTSVCRGRDRMVVLIVLHLYSLLLPYFILQLGPSWSWSYSSSYCVTLVFTTITMLHTSVRRGRDRMVVWFTTICAIRAYHHYRCEFESCSWRGVLDITLCDKVFEWLVTGRWFSPVSSTNKTPPQNNWNIVASGNKYH